MGIGPQLRTTEPLPELPKRDTDTLQGHNPFGTNQLPGVSIIFVEDLEGHPFMSLALSTLHTLTGISPSG
jgi:hypothetical protein